jgi:uncharacterized protein (TIGR02301 family)
MMLARRTLIAALLLLTATAAPSRAQGVGSALEDNLSRLSEILGALHYLRTICNGREGNRWRSEMQQLIEAEGASAERKARMTASFNRGYNGYQQTYRVCTPAAEVAVRRYLDEGSKLAREVGARYSN